MGLLIPAILFFVFVSVGHAQQQCLNSGCEPGWSPLNGNCYKVLDDGSKTRDEAERTCAQFKNGHLASVHSQAEQQLVADLVKAFYYANRARYSAGALFWIGMQLYRQNGPVVGSGWTDGSNVDFGNPLQTAGKDPWCTRGCGNGVQPGYVPDANCVLSSYWTTDTTTYGYWYSNICSIKAGYVCKSRSSCQTDGGKPQPQQCDCDVGWSYFDGAFYKVFDDNKNWEQAKEACGQFRGNLVSIHSKEEQNHVAGILKAFYARGKFNDPVKHFYNGMQLKRDQSNKIIEATWSDESDVNYGSPLGTQPGSSPWSDGKLLNFAPEPSSSCACPYVGHVMAQQSTAGDWSSVVQNGRPAGYICKTKAFG